jgi:hypothetical protein
MRGHRGRAPASYASLNALSFADLSECAHTPPDIGANFTTDAGVGVTADVTQRARDPGSF